MWNVDLTRSCLVLALLSGASPALADNGLVAPVISVSEAESMFTVAEAALGDGVLTVDDCCQSDECTCDSPARQFGLRGWIAQGFTGNFSAPTNRENTPVTFNDRANEYQLNQFYLIAEREVENDYDWDLGGRIDILFGTDYYFVSSLGLENHANGSGRWNGAGPRGAAPASASLYGVALPQAYAEIAAPVLGGTSLKAGHFYSPLGFERAGAPDNFFYSHSYARQYAKPMTLTGLLAESQVGTRLSVLAGATAGWNNFSSLNNAWGWLAGFRFSTLDCRTSLSWMVHGGKDTPPGLNLPGFFAGPPSLDDVTVSTLVLQRQLSDQLRYVLQADVGTEQDGEVEGARTTAAKWYGLNQYFLYDYNACWSFGLRFEWFRDQDHARVLRQPVQGTLSGGNYFNLTGGLNWTPNDRLVVRPELRWDWSDTDGVTLPIGGPFDFFSSDSQLTLAIDAVFLF